MTGRTLSFYFARDFLGKLTFVFFLFLGLIIAIDMVELSRQLGGTVNAGFTDILLIALYRAPGFAGNVLPFATLFGAAASLLFFNRKLELVVARAAGISVWQFLLPFVLTAGLVGIATSMLYNPLSLAGEQLSRTFEARAFGRVKGAYTNKNKNFWQRIAYDDAEGGDVVVRARVAQNSGRELTGVSIYRFGKNGAAVERIDAAAASFVEESGKAFYRLTDASVTELGTPTKSIKQFDVPVKISARELDQRSTDAAKVSFWQLGNRAESASVSGANALPFQTQFQHLLSQPLLFIAMVMLAATISLRFARFGQSGKAILAGILAGFVLYVASRLLLTFGSNGLVSPTLAAWSPAAVAVLIATTVLLYQEDG